MRGVILAGGLGTRLSPLTRVTNKHLLPVWDRPMIHYPIENLVKSGIDEILIVTGGQHAGHFLNLLKNGKELGIKHLEYAYQEGEGGIADALKLARDFVEDKPVCVMLGDNIYQYNISKARQFFEQCPATAMVLAKPADNQQLDPKRFGVLVYGKQSMTSQRFVPLQIVEKPSEKDLWGWKKVGKYCHILTGTYFFTPMVFDVCEGLKPSTRGELEISDVNQHYLNQGQLASFPIKGWWSDAGTFPSLFNASKWVKMGGANNDPIGS